MEISEIIMETFTLGTAIGLNMTHNASFCAESVNAAAWNRARLVEVKLSCFCWYINALVKSTRLENFQREREYGWKCFVRLRQKRSNIYTARTTNFIFWIQLEKQPLSQSIVSIMWAIDK